jgi:hypothetical protein
LRIRIADPDSGSGSRIRIPDPDPGFDDLKLKKITAEKKLIFFYQKLQFTYPRASIKDAQAKGQVFSPQKRTSSTSKHENSVLFSIFVGHFSLLDPDPDQQFECGSGSGSSNSN